MMLRSTAFYFADAGHCGNRAGIVPTEKPPTTIRVRTNGLDTSRCLKEAGTSHLAYHDNDNENHELWCEQGHDYLIGGAGEKLNQSFSCFVGVEFEQTVCSAFSAQLSKRWEFGFTDKILAQRTLEKVLPMSQVSETDRPLRLHAGGQEVW